MNACLLVDSMGRQLIAAVQMANDQDEGGERVGDLDQGLTIEPHRSRRDNGRSAAFMQIAGVFLVFDESDIARLGFVQRPSGAYDGLAVALQFSLHEFRKLSNGGTHARTPFLP